MNKKIQSQVNKNKEIISNQFQISKDVILGAPIIHMTGNYDVWIENYKGIISYNEERIVLQSKVGRITVTGKNLFISYYTNEDMKIAGNIYGVFYGE